jgi:hypothetical protein
MVAGYAHFWSSMKGKQVAFMTRKNHGQPKSIDVYVLWKLLLTKKMGTTKFEEYHISANNALSEPVFLVIYHILLQRNF